MQELKINMHSLMIHLKKFYLRSSEWIRFKLKTEFYQKKISQITIKA